MLFIHKESSTETELASAVEQRTFWRGTCESLTIGGKEMQVRHPITIPCAPDPGSGPASYFYLKGALS